MKPIPILMHSVRSEDRYAVRAELRPESIMRLLREGALVVETGAEEDEPWPEDATVVAVGFDEETRTFLLEMESKTDFPLCRVDFIPFRVHLATRSEETERG